MLKHQRIAFAYAFQTALSAKCGSTHWLDKQGKRGAILPSTKLLKTAPSTRYAIASCLDMGLSGRIITHKEGYHYLAKVGQFFTCDVFVEYGSRLSGLLFMDILKEMPKPQD